MSGRRDRIALAAVAVVVAMAAWAWWLQRPPAPLPADAPGERFAAGRAVDHLMEIAAAPHLVGSAEHARVRAYIVAELRRLGLETEVQEATVVEPRGRIVRVATVRNVVARRRGTDSSGGVALAAHYDSQQLAAGAGDDGAAVAAILETLRALRQGPPLRNDLYVIITDAEELGLLGARAFVEEHPWWPEIDVLLSFEARGSAGPSVMFETSAGNGWVVRQLAEADPYPAGSSLFYQIYQRLPNDTDFSVYKRAGVTGLNFAFAEGSDAYHRSTDTIERLSMASLQHHGEHALSLARRFGGLDLPPPQESADVVFFPLGGRALITYPTSWVLPLTGWALLVTGLVAAYGFRRRQVAADALLAGAGLVVVAAAGAAALAWALMKGVGTAHHEQGSIIGRRFYEEGWYLLAVVSVSVAAVGAVYAAFRRRFSAAGLALGAATVPLLLAVVAAIQAPGVNMLFLWPLLFAMAALRYLLSLPPDRPAGPAELAIVSLLAIPVFLLQVPLVWAVYVGLGIAAAPLLAALIVLLLILLLPHFEIAGRPDRRWLPATALLLALLFAIAGVIDARPGPDRPAPVDLVYALDRDTGAAVWATMTPPPRGDGVVDSWLHDWLGRFFPAGGQPAGEQAAGGQPATGEPVRGEQAAGRQAAGEQPAGEQPAREQAGGEQPAGEAAGGGQVIGDLAPFLSGNLRPYRLAPAPAVDDTPAVATIVEEATDGGVRRVRLEIQTAGPVELVTIEPSPPTGATLALRTVNGVAVAVAGTPRNWLLHHFGRPPGGILTLDLQIDDPAAPIELVLVETAMRLPEVPGLDTRRPAELVAHGARLTDVSLFRQVLRFE